MNTNIKLALVLIIVIMVGCGKKEPAKFQLTKGTVIIEGKVSNFQNSSDLIQFLGNDIITYQIVQYTRIDSSGNFRKEIDIYHPQALSIKYLSGWANLFVKPGDSLFIEMDANLFEKNDSPYYKVTGSNAETSNNMRDFRIFFQCNFDFDNNNKPVKEFLDSLKKNMNLEISLLKEFQKKHKTTKDFKNWAYNDIVYGNANFLISYAMINERNNIKIEGNLADKKLFPVNNDSAVAVSTYITHLGFYYTQTYILGDSLILDLEKQNKYKEAAIYIISKITKNEEPGLSRDYMIYHLLQYIFVKSPEDFASLLKEKKTNIHSKEILDNLYKIKSDYEKKINNEEITDTNRSDTTSAFWNNLKAKHKNKIIYIDIFATWCGPCRYEIPHAQDLHKDFEGKPVAFVNLCMASEREDWDKMISQNELKGDNYFINKDETIIFRSELNFPGYPTYMIIDKNGNIINKNAPRPSQRKEITELLNNLIKE